MHEINFTSSWKKSEVCTLYDTVYFSNMFICIILQIYWRLHHAFMFVKHHAIKTRIGIFIPSLIENVARLPVFIALRVTRLYVPERLFMYNNSIYQEGGRWNRLRDVLLSSHSGHQVRRGTGPGHLSWNQSV